MTTIRISPARRNNAARYLQRYLNTLTDWQTYAAVPPDRLPDKLQDVTTAFFSPARLKGAAFLFAIHLLQQSTASLATLPARAWLAADRLDTCRGITVRRSRAEAWWPKLPASLRGYVALGDAYLFSEGGRTWHCHTLRFLAPALLAGKTMTALTLLSLPNRAFFFDRALPYHQAVDLALARLDADDLPGCLGRTNELDCLLPSIRALKLSLTWLNWLLIDSDEREEGGPDVSGYDDWTPVPPAPATPAAPYGFTRPDPGFTPPPRPGYTPGWGTVAAHAPVPAIWPVQPPPPPLPATMPAPVTVKLAPPDGGEAIAYTIPTAARLVLTPFGAPSGLALTPLIEPQPDGSYRERADLCLLTHVPSGLAMNADRPLPSLEAGQTLAARLLPLTDWSRALNALPPAALEQAQRIIGDFVPSPGVFSDHNGRGGPDVF